MSLVKLRSYWIRVVLDPLTSVLIRRGVWTQTEWHVKTKTQEEGHVKMAAES